MSGKMPVKKTAKSGKMPVFFSGILTFIARQNKKKHKKQPLKILGNS